MSDTLSTESETRAEKLELLRSRGINPYPSDSFDKTEIAEALDKKPQDVVIAGKIFSIRAHGKSTFMDLKDESGKMQVYFKFDNLGEQNYENLKLLDSGDYIEAKGNVFVTKMGETTLEVKEWRILSKSLHPLPDSWYGFKDVESRYRKRYLDLIMSDEIKKTLRVRSQIISTLRAFMEKNGFLEFETPILQPIPGGASAKPFITHYNILKQDMYLRIAPELYLKRLVVGGFEKVYEIGRQFRNEGLSHMHNPEFTSMEFYWANKNYEDLMAFTEELMTNLVTTVKGDLKITYQDNEINFAAPYPKISFDALIEKDCGINIYKYPEYEDLLKVVKDNGIKLEFSQIKVWPKLVDELYKKVSRPGIIQPTFVVDHPIDLVPLAKAKDDDPQKSQTFQLVCAGGFEMLKAYTEQNDPIEQENRFKEQIALSKAGWDESNMMDENFIDALKYGLPPTAGWGMGIERIAMILADQYSIKEVIAFPTLKNQK